MESARGYDEGATGRPAARDGETIPHPGVVGCPQGGRSRLRDHPQKKTLGPSKIKPRSIQTDRAYRLYCQIATVVFVINTVYPLTTKLLQERLAEDWLQTAALNPFSYAVDATRALFDGDFGDPAVIHGFGIMATLTLLALLWAARTFRRATA